MFASYPSWLAALLPSAASIVPTPAPTPPVVVNPFAVDLYAYLAQALPAIAVYPSRLAEKGVVFPAMTFNLITVGRFGRLKGSSGVAIDRYQFDVWSPDMLDAALAAEQLRHALQGYQGVMGTTSVAQSLLVSTMTGFEPPIDSSDVGLFRVMQEFSITRAESIPTPGPA